MKINFLASLLVFFSLTHSDAASKPNLLSNLKTIQTSEQLHEWMTYYYLNPKPELTLSALRFMHKDGTLMDRKRSFSIAAIYTQVVLLNPKKVDEWVKQIKSDHELIKFQMAVVLQQAQLKNSGQMIDELCEGASPNFKKIAQEMKAKSKNPNLMTDPIDGPVFLDALWASYFISGDKKYIQRLIGALSMLSSKDKFTHLLGEAAKWSLGSNLKQHPKLMAIYQDEVNRASPDIKSILKEMIK
jgi:hypothetical protein